MVTTNDAAVFSLVNVQFTPFIYVRFQCPA
jgi:hypothetical protein